jgi:hypothetical protein
MNRIAAIMIAWTTKEYIKNLLRINAKIHRKALCKFRAFPANVLPSDSTSSGIHPSSLFSPKLSCLLFQCFKSVIVIWKFIQVC